MTCFAGTTLVTYYPRANIKFIGVNTLEEKGILQELKSKTNSSTIDGYKTKTAAP